MIKDPAFPVSNGVDTDFGMSMRQYYKAAALTGLLSDCDGTLDNAQMAKICGWIADEMVKEDEEHERV